MGGVKQPEQLALFAVPKIYPAGSGKEHHKDPPAKRRLRRGRWFDAKKKGLCDSCGSPIGYGDRIWLVPYFSAICFACKVAHIPDAT